MKAHGWERRFFATTRGRVVALLRGNERTVTELAELLELTDNAVRSHLARLERDGLVRQSGMRRGVRRPHVAYELTPEAEALFPKAYVPVLSLLISVLKERRGPEELDAVLREMGVRMARPYAVGKGKKGAAALGARIKLAQKALDDLGGMTEIEQEGEKVSLRGDSCPLAAVVTEHAEACRIAESLVAEITGLKVREVCRRDRGPMCCFELTKPEEAE